MVPMEAKIGGDCARSLSLALAIFIFDPIHAEVDILRF